MKTLREFSITDVKFKKKWEVCFETETKPRLIAKNYVASVENVFKWLVKHVCRSRYPQIMIGMRWDNTAENTLALGFLAATADDREEMFSAIIDIH